jgi:hypothetical protein
MTMPWSIHPNCESLFTDATPGLIQSAGIDANDADDDDETMQGKLVRQKSFRVTSDKALTQTCLLQETFDLAPGEILVWPRSSSQQRMEESHKCFLLPEDYDANYGTPMFSTVDCTMSQLKPWKKTQTLNINVSSVASDTKKFRSVPEPFVGHQVSTYEIPVAFAQQFSTTAHIDVILYELQQKLSKMTAMNDFDGAKATLEKISDVLHKLESEFDLEKELGFETVKMKPESERISAEDLSEAEKQVASKVASSSLSDPHVCAIGDSGDVCFTTATFKACTTFEACTTSNVPPSLIPVLPLLSSDASDRSFVTCREEKSQSQDRTAVSLLLEPPGGNPLTEAQPGPTQSAVKNENENDTDDNQGPMQGMPAPHKAFRIARERSFTDVLTVFQATPLVYLDMMNRPCLHDAVDVEHEQKELSKALKGSSIAVKFEVATTKQLSAFLAKEEGRVLHITCHGNPGYLAIEDGWGAVQHLDVESVKKWIALAGKPPQLVFVAACHSHSIGQAFADAGVPHVVCCSHNDHLLHADAAVKFASVFYRALADGHSLQKAFDLARAQIVVWPGFTTSQERMEESGKYCLLPKHTNHNVQVFSTSDCTMSPPPPWKTTQTPTMNGMNGSSVSSAPNKFPPLPGHFVRRELPTYEVLRKLRWSRLVIVTGPPKIGKSVLVRACCHLVSKRRPDVDLDEIVWVPFAHDDNEDFFSHWLADIFENARLETYSIGLFREYCTSRLRTISQYLRDQGSGALLVLEAKHLSQAGVSKLSFFVKELLKQTSQHDKDVKVIIIDGEHDRFGSMASPEFSIAKSLVEVTNLGLEDTIELFGRTCLHVGNINRDRIVGRKALVKHLMPTCQRAWLSKRCASIMDLLGQGNPGIVIEIANQMTIEEYKSLAAIGDQEEFDLPLGCRAKLIHRAQELQKDIASARTLKDVTGVQKRQSECDLIQYHLKEMQSLNSMEEKLASVTFEILVSSGKADCSKLGRLAKTRYRLEKKITLEKEAMCSLGMLEAHEAFAQQFPTGAHIDVKIKELKQTLTKMTAMNDFFGAKATHEEVVALEDLKLLRPSIETLSTCESKLEEILNEAKSSSSYDRAQEIYDRLKKVKMKLELERKAETELSAPETQVSCTVASSCLKDSPVAVNDVSSGKSESVMQDEFEVGDKAKLSHAITAN